jgi:GH15 family glucan-1,4-alpha-glucosidase
MKMGTHTFTTATVYQALLCVARFANLLGKEYDEQQYLHAAEEIKEAATMLVNPKTEFFYKSIELKDGEILHDETIDASSFYGADHFSLFDEKTMDEMYKIFQRELMNREGSGGVVRFVNDAYFRDKSESKGNPWIVTTLWQAQHIISRAKSESDMKPVIEILQWVHTLAAPSGVLPEQVDPVSAVSKSASPLAWSHAEFITTVLMYLEKLEELGICDVCPPLTEPDSLGV